MASIIARLMARSVNVRPATIVVVMALQICLTVACVLVLRLNTSLEQRAEIYRKRSAPIAGRPVPTLTGLDWAGNKRSVEYKDSRPTLIYSFNDSCGACEANWPALRSVQELSPIRLRIVYVNPYDKLSEAYLREHGLDEDVLFTKLDELSAASYEIRATPQTELVDRQGRVIWSNVGAFRPTDLAALVTAIEEHERQPVEVSKGAER